MEAKSFHSLTSTAINKERRDKMRYSSLLRDVYLIMLLLGGLLIHFWRCSCRDPLRTINGIDRDV